MTPLTIHDLQETLADERHNGWGYATVEGRLQTRVDRKVVEAANELGWDYEDLFLWSDSKYGRWLGDSLPVGKTSAAELDAVVRDYVNANALARLKEEA